MQEFMNKLSPNSESNKETPQFWPNRSESTMDAIKSIIIKEGLEEGSPLPSEAKLCETLGVSRSSVREALRKLEALDIVTVQQGRGSFVGPMSLQPMVETLVLRNSTNRGQSLASFEDVVNTRKMLDQAVAPQLVEKLKDTKQERLWELVKRMKIRAEKGESYWEEDIAFHSELLANLDNELIQRIMSAMWLVHQAILPQIRSEEQQRFSSAAHAHQKMLQAAIDGDLEAYLEAIESHYHPLREIIRANKDLL